MNVNRQYIGARYVPLFFENPKGGNDWLSGYQYDALTIVTYLNQSYTSKKVVPATVGNPKDNPEYWVMTANYNAQVEEYRKQVEQAKKDIDGSEQIYQQTMQNQYNQFTTSVNNTVANNRTEMLNKINNLEQSLGSPSVVESIENMTNHDRLYILKSNGHLYYYEEGWKDSGIVYGDNYTPDVVKMTVYQSVNKCVTYDVKARTVHFNLGAISLPNGSSISVGPVDINLSQENLPAWRLYANPSAEPTKRIEAYFWNVPNPNKDAMLIGQIWEDAIWVSGINKEQIIVLNPVHPKYHNNIAMYNCTENPSVIVDTNNHTITFKQGNYIYENHSKTCKGQTISYADLVGEPAIDIYIDTTAQVDCFKLVAYASQVQEDKYALVGQYFNKNLFIFGLANDFVYINTSKSANNVVALSPQGVNKAIVYDNVNHRLTINQATVVANNKGVVSDGVTIDLPKLPSDNSPNAWLIWAELVGDKYEYSASYIFADFEKNKKLVGTIFNECVWFAGVDPKCIYVTNPRRDFVTTKFGAYLTSDNPGVVIDIEAHTALFNVGFFVHNNYGSPVVKQTVDFAGNIDNAWTIWIDYVDGTANITITNWKEYHKYVDSYLIGVIFGKSATIFGMPHEQVVVKTGGRPAICFFGDSITAGAGTTKAYHQYISEKYSVRCLNYGVGSTGFTINTSSTVVIGNGVEGIGKSELAHGNNTILDVIKSVSDIKACSIAAGTNDYGGNVDIDTFESAVDETFKYITRITPYVTVLLPIQRSNTGENNKGKTLKDYCDVIINKCEQYGIKWFNGYNEIPFKPSIELNKTTFIPDGLHPNAKGHEIIAKLYGPIVDAITSPIM